MKQCSAVTACPARNTPMVAVRIAARTCLPCMLPLYSLMLLTPLSMHQRSWQCCRPPMHGKASNSLQIFLSRYSRTRHLPPQLRHPRLFASSFFPKLFPVSPEVCFGTPTLCFGKENHAIQKFKESLGGSTGCMFFRATGCKGSGSCSGNRTVIVSWWGAHFLQLSLRDAHAITDEHLGDIV